MAEPDEVPVLLVRQMKVNGAEAAVASSQQPAPSPADDASSKSRSATRAWRLLMARIARLVRRFAAERAARRAIRELEAMHELELRDLALYRDDIRRVVLEGRWNTSRR